MCDVYLLQYRHDVSLVQIGNAESLILPQSREQSLPASSRLSSLTLEASNALLPPLRSHGSTTNWSWSHVYVSVPLSILGYPIFL